MRNGDRRELRGFVGKRAAIDLLQNGVSLPAAGLHDILIRDPEGVPDRCRICTQIVEAEIREAGSLSRDLETLSQILRIHRNDPITWSAVADKDLNSSLRKIDAADGLRRLRRFNNPFTVRRENHILRDGDGRSGDILTEQGTDLTAAKRPERREQDRAFKIRAGDEVEELPDVLVRRRVKIRNLFLRKTDIEPIGRPKHLHDGRDERCGIFDGFRRMVRGIG